MLSVTSGFLSHLSHSCVRSAAGVAVWLGKTGGPPGLYLHAEPPAPRAPLGEGTRDEWISLWHKLLCFGNVGGGGVCVWQCSELTPGDPQGTTVLGIQLEPL